MERFLSHSLVEVPGSVPDTHVVAQQPLGISLPRFLIHASVGRRHVYNTHTHTFRHSHIDIT